MPDVLLIANRTCPCPQVLDADPLQAIQDAVSGFPAEEIVISTFPAEDSHWLEKNLLARASEATGLPIVHVTSSYGLPAIA